MQLSALSTTVVVVVVLVALAAVWAYKTANRLDRLNVRVDLARQALVAALDRRAVVTRALAASMSDDDDDAVRALARTLAAAADTAEHAPIGERERAENVVSTMLARADPASRPRALAAELADADARVMMARRFYNDAVRDTLALAGRRPVRWGRLGGTAELPQYFEVVERVAPTTSE